jgi:uncharacterized protein
MATALELTREGWQPYLKVVRRPSPTLPLAASFQAERERVFGLVRKAADVLKSRFGVRRVILFGSIARTESFYAQSDVDLAVEGLREDDYWEAWRMVEEIIADRPVDLIDMEIASQSILKAIQRYGIDL